MTVLENNRIAGPRTPEVVDLRGAGAPAPTAVLADPTGRRAALLRTFGRFVGLLFVLWFCGLVLAGLGLLPLSDLPLARSLGTAGQPKKLAALPRPRPPSRRDLVPARPLPAATHAPTTARQTAPATATRPTGVTRRHSTTTPTTPAATTTRPGRRLGNSNNPATAAPTATTPATTTTTHGKSGTAPAYGRQTTTTSTTPTTAPGRSGNAPGHDPTGTPGHGASVH